MSISSTTIRKKKISDLPSAPQPDANVRSAYTCRFFFPNLPSVPQPDGNVGSAGYNFKALSSTESTPTYLNLQYPHLSISIFFIHDYQQRQLTKLSITTSNFIRVYLHKLGNWGVQVCGCTRQGLKAIPCGSVYARCLSVKYSHLKFHPLPNL